MFVQFFFKYLTIEKAWSALYIKAKEEMVRYLAEPRNILAEPLGSAEPRLKNTGLRERTTDKANKNSY
jgi:hypothetical protein